MVNTNKTQGGIKMNIKLKDMKIHKILNLIIVSMLLFTVSCDPIVDSEDLTNTTNVDGVELVALQSTPGGNGITLQMKTPGVTGWWDFNIGRSYSDEAKFNYPIPGTQTFTFTGTLGAEFFTKTIDVQIDVLDQPLNQDWYDLVSNDTSAGKTWVFEDETPWYMAPINGAPDSYSTIWWDAWSCCLADANGKMKFDLDGGANYTYYDNAGVPQEGSFALDIPNQVLDFVGAPVLGGQDGLRLPGDGVYHIISLTEDELILWTPLTVAGDSGWCWQFKAE